jgi:hypothetical protein
MNCVIATKTKTTIIKRPFFIMRDRLHLNYRFFTIQLMLHDRGFPSGVAATISVAAYVGLDEPDTAR